MDRVEEKAYTAGRREVRGEVESRGVDQRERRPTALKPAPWKDGPAAAAAVPARTEAERTAVVRAIEEAVVAARREAARRRREEAFMIVSKASNLSPFEGNLSVCWEAGR